MPGSTIQHSCLRYACPVQVTANTTHCSVYYGAARLTTKQWNPALLDLQKETSNEATIAAIYHLIMLKKEPSFLVR